MKENSRPASHKANFYGFDFYVDKTILTPRPETEGVIDEVLRLTGRPILPGVRPEKAVLDPTGLKILDVGTGSGCIAITLKKLLPEATIYASDISKDAISITKKNAESLGAPIITIISHLLEEVNSGEIPTPDIIVANLPYVDKNWDWLDRESLKDDPDLALYAEDGGLKLIKELIDTATSKYLILEADPSEHQSIIDYAKARYKLLNINGFILTFINNF